MPIATGTRLGPYEIVAPIGAGGMGEVYRARDTRLDRAVAIKILPSDFARDSKLKIRFQREARTISQLSHPNICTLFDVGDNYLVMELLDGESLADRLSRGPLSLPEVLKYGMQIAEALGKAHRQGIVHRDVKPGNVMITKSGAKLLDFGLAKTNKSNTAPEEATAQKPLTAEGTVVGTFQYMAPEQLAGEEPDERTDIFGLGAVLYEMITGKRAFDGKTKTSLIAAIVSGEPPPLTQFQPLTPPALDHVIRKCLAKERDDRWQNASDIAEDLRWINGAGSAAGVAAPVTRQRKGRERVWIAMAALFAAALVVVMPLYWRIASHKPELMHLGIPLPAEVANFRSMAISPDGSRLAIQSGGGGGMIWVRSLNSSEAAPVAGTQNGFGFPPFWSADGKFIGFFSEKKLRKVAATGGPSQAICDAVAVRGGTWNSEGTIVFAPNIFSGLYKVSQNGGTPVPVTVLDAKRERSQRWPFFLPDGRHFLYTDVIKRSDGPDRTAIMMASLDSSTSKVLIDNAAYGYYAEPGWVIFARKDQPNEPAASLMAIRFDTQSFTTIGDPLVVPIGRIEFDGNGNFACATLAGTGTLVYQRWIPPPKDQLRWVDRDGKALRNEEQSALWEDGALSPDGKRIALMRDNDLWIHQVGAPNSSRFTFDTPRYSYAPKWSKDGSRLYYVAYNTVSELALMVKSATGAAKGEEIYRGATLGWGGALDVSPDGRFLLIPEQFSATGVDIMMVDLATRRVVPFVSSPANEFGPAFSPDGKWVAYNSNNQFYVRRFPDTGEQWQVNEERVGVAVPIWSRDGKSIFYVANETLMRIPVKLGATFEAGAPEKRFACDGFIGESVDGKEFLVIENEKHKQDNFLDVVLNWPRLIDQ